jgi:hypothetical protein
MATKEHLGGLTPYHGARCGSAVLATLIDTRRISLTFKANDRERESRVAQGANSFCLSEPYSIFLQNRVHRCGGFLQSECTRRNQGCNFDPANAALAWHCAVPIAEHASSNMACEKELLGAPKKARSPSYGPWPQRHFGVLTHGGYVQSGRNIPC